MRRQDLVLDLDASLKVVDQNHFAVLCLKDPEQRPYGVPLDYVRKENALYFHGAKEGRKVSSMKANPWACAVIIGENEIIAEKFGRKYIYIGMVKVVAPVLLAILLLQALGAF